MKISIVTACLNSASHITDCLQSVEQQVGVDIEHLIIDGGSTDGTIEILRSRSAPWRKVISGRDGGMYQAMNKGIALASGDIVGFLNSDDVYSSPDILKSVAREFSDQTLAACWGDLVYVNYHDLESRVRVWKSAPFKRGLFAHGWNPPHPTFFARRGLYERYGSFRTDYKMGNDVELMARFLEHHGILGRYLPVQMVKMRIGGVSNRDIRGIILQNRELLRAFRDLGIACSPTAFVFGKIWSRGWQYFSARRGGGG
jgi:glycosyltransferase involved in cell wall biosynthesis